MTAGVSCRPCANGSGDGALDADAAYCAMAGALLIGLRRARAPHWRSAPRLVGLGGAATVIWAGLVALVHRRRPARPLAVVGTANVVAATALMAAAVRQPGAARRRFLTAAGLEVASFAAFQALALGLSEPAACDESRWRNEDVCGSTRCPAARSNMAHLVRVPQ